MKTVKLTNNVVVEIIPDYALPAGKWYGERFAAQCVDAPDDVIEGMVYNPEDGTFSAPEPEPAPEPTPQADTDAMLVDHEYRLILLEVENTSLTAKLNASIQSNQFLEDCLVEIAETVYA